MEKKKKKSIQIESEVLQQSLKKTAEEEGLLRSKSMPFLG